MKCLIVLIGPPGAGKTTHCLDRLSDAVRISQDDDGPLNWEIFKEAISENKRTIVVDRMNFSVEQRMRYVVPAIRAGYKIKYVHFDRDFNTCFSRVINRTEHPTIRFQDYKTTTNALSNYFKRFELPKEWEYDELERL